MVPKTVKLVDAVRRRYEMVRVAAATVVTQVVNDAVIGYRFFVDGVREAMEKPSLTVISSPELRYDVPVVIRFDGARPAAFTLYDSLFKPFKCGYHTLILTGGA